MKKYRTLIVVVGIIVLSIGGYFIANKLLFTGITPLAIDEDGFQANYFTPNRGSDKLAVVLIGGGQWGDYWAQEFASKEIAGLSIPYIRREGLPELPEEIELEYFENALKWLGQQKEVDSEKIVLMGASRNAELALLIASTFPNLASGVVAYAPSSVAWSNTVLPYSSNEIKPSWVYQGGDIPYVAMEKISENESGELEMLSYWEGGLLKSEEVERASIQVEKINGPILLFSGLDDKVWPSALMADKIEERLKANNFRHSIQNFKYKNAGHLISTNPEGSSNIRTNKIKVAGKDYEYEFGGTNEGDSKAKKDAKLKLFDFLEKI